MLFFNNSDTNSGYQQLLINISGIVKVVRASDPASRSRCKGRHESKIRKLKN